MKIKDFFQGMIGITLMSLIFFSGFQVQADLVWSENFNSGTSEELTLCAWTTSSGIFHTNDSGKPTIVNYALQMPNNRESHTWSAAQCNSTVAYGTWSFDYTVKKGTDHTAADAIFFIMNGMKWDMDGLPPSGDFVGYILAIKTSNQDNVWPDDSRDVVLGQFVPISHDYYQRRKYQFSSDITGTHQVNITRDLGGHFNVYWDSNLIITYSDNTTKTSEMCVFGSWTGDTTYDNIVVRDDVVDISTPPTTDSTPILELTIVIDSIFLIVVMSRFRKKYRKN